MPRGACSPLNRHGLAEGTRQTYDVRSPLPAGTRRCACARLPCACGGVHDVSIMKTLDRATDVHRQGLTDARVVVDHFSSRQCAPGDLLDLLRLLDADGTDVTWAPPGTPHQRAVQAAAGS